MIHFVKTLTPCIADEVILWHVAHGWVWNVMRNGKAVAVFFVTILCGDGVILHFSTLPDAQIPPADILSAFRKGVRIAQPFGLLMATIPLANRQLLNVVQHLGFVPIASYDRSGREIALLKYISPPKDILSPKPQPKE